MKKCWLKEYRNLININELDISKHYHLLMCSFCKKTDNILNETYFKLFTLPMACCLDESMSEELITDFKASFKRESDYKERFKSFFVAFYKVLTKEITLYDFIGQLVSAGEYSYLEFIYYLLHTDKKIAAIIIYMYFEYRVIVPHTGLRSRYYFDKTEKDNLFFDIGMSFDEGITQKLTNRLINDFNENENAAASTADKAHSPIYEWYHCEIKFIDKIIEYGFTTEEEIFKVAFNDNPAEYFYKIFYNDNSPCDFINVFQLTDQQNWIKAMQLLKSLINVRGNNYERI